MTESKQTRRVLDVVKRDQDYVLFQDGQPLLTPEGIEIAHPNERVPEQLLREILMNAPASHPIAGLLLFRITEQLKRADTDFFLEQSDALLAMDPLINRAAFDQATGKQCDTEFMMNLMEDQQHMALFFNGLNPAIQAFQRFLLEYSEGHFDYTERTQKQIHSIFQAAYTELAIEEKAALQVLCGVHCCGPLLAILTLRSYLSPSEHANAMFALHQPQQSDIQPNPRTFLDPVDILRDLSPILPDWQQQATSFNKLHRDVFAILDYLICAEPVRGGNAAIRTTINHGESYRVEFKTSLRWNIKAEKKDAAIEHACLKTVNAFLNSAGGTLLIGVRDDGSIEGTDIDRFANDDKFSLHFWNLIKASMGQGTAPLIRTSFETVNEKTIFVVRCSPGTTPQFLNQKGFDEEFYIRVGPSSAKLSMQEAFQYIAGRYKQHETGSTDQNR